ncbi:MAG: sodium-coupled permease [Planctomycetaceae bacterium]
MKLSPLLQLTTLLSAMLTSGAAWGQSTDSAVVPADVHGTNGLAMIDWIIIVVYAGGTILLGWYYSRRQSSTKEYFVGTGNMNPLLIGVSLFATLLSTITYLSLPGENIGKGPMYLLSMLAMPAVFWFVGFVLLPVYMKQRVTSAYELLEEKLGPEIRTLGALMFVTLRLIWMSLLIYLTAKAMTTMLGVGEERIPQIALITGFVAVIYTSMGGLRAVVITDFLQTILLFGGAWLVLATITWNLGGLRWIPTKWNPNWDVQPIFSTDPSTRVTLFGTILGYFVWYVCTLGGDQTSVQRFMATKDAGAARRALATQLLVNLAVSITLALVGFALLGYFTAHPERLTSTMTLAENADDIFPHFIAFHLPPGVSGLVVSAMFAAAMSSIDSGVNSITAVVMTDLIGRRRPTMSGTDAAVDKAQPTPYTAPGSETSDAAAEDRRHVVTARWMAFVIGGIVVAVSSQMGAVPGNITAVTTKTANLLTTPIFALFFFALFVPFASPKGVIIGAIFGVTTAASIAFSGPISAMVGPLVGYVPQTEKDPISFQWIAPIAITVNLAAGCIGSLLFPRPSPPSTDH